MAVRRLVYISRSPQDMVKDLDLLRQLGYRLDEMKQFDGCPNNMEFISVLKLTLTHHALSEEKDKKENILAIDGGRLLLRSKEHDSKKFFISSRRPMPILIDTPDAQKMKA